MKIVKITVLMRTGHKDTITVYFDAPAPFKHRLEEEDVMTGFTTDASPGAALPWVQAHFADIVKAGALTIIDVREK